MKNLPFIFLLFSVLLLAAVFLFRFGSTQRSRSDFASNHDAKAPQAPEGRAKRSAPGVADRESTSPQAEGENQSSGTVLLGAPNPAAPPAKVILPEQPPVTELAAKAGKEAPSRVFRFAEPVKVHLNPNNSGKWRHHGNQANWRLEIQSPQARSINLGFSKYRMPRGGKLQVFAPENEEAPTYRPFTEQDNEEHGQLWTPIIRGESIVIEVTLPQEERKNLELELTQVSHGFRGIRPAEKVAGSKIGSGTSGSCNIDVVCDGSTLPGGVGAMIDAMREQIRSVGAYTLNGTDTCSGALINNQRADNRPYFLTADHCGVDAGNAPSMVVYWNFENSACRTPGGAASGQQGDGDLSDFNTGSIFRAANAASDFCLVELDDFIDPAYDVFFAGWDRTDNDPTTSVAIHHPAVAEKRISFDLNPAQTVASVYSNTPTAGGTHLRIENWEHGTTEGGSSGSPLFNQNGRIVGQLEGGDAACGNSLPDWYGRLATSWTGGGSSSSRLSDWLDPDNSGANTLDGAEQDDLLTIDDPALTEGNSGSSSMDFTVTLVRVSTETVDVNWTTQDGTATTADSDYVADSGTVTFLAGETSKTISVQINGDTPQEEHETVQVVLSNAVNAVIADTTGTGTIENDDWDVAPVITSSTSADGIENQPFTYQIEADNTPTGYSMGTNFPAGMAVDGNGLVTWTPPSSGNFTADIEASNPAGTGSATLNISIAQNSLEDALDNANFIYTAPVSSNEDWFMQGAQTYDGTDAAQSGAITDDEESSFQFSVSGPDYLVFHWKVDSEQGFDILSVNIDGTEAAQVSGFVEWERKVIEIPSGSHTVSFTYDKDSSVSIGADAGYVDQLALASTLPDPVITSPGAAAGAASAPFSYQITTANPATSYAAVDLPAGLSIDTLSGEITGTPSVAGTFTASLTATNPTGSDTRDLDFEIFTSADAIAGAPGSLGGPVTWYGTGDADWFVQSTTSRDGSAMQSGAIGNSEFSSLTGIVTGPVDVTFYWKVSSEEFFDFLDLYIDGKLDRSISGEVNWREETVSIPAGDHFLKFIYQKDSSDLSGADAGWLDSFDFVFAATPDPVTGVITRYHSPSSMKVSWAAASGATSYQIWRGAAADFGSMTQIGTSSNAEFVDSTVVTGQEYFYRVVSENASGAAAESSAAQGILRGQPDLWLRKRIVRGKNIYNTYSGQTLTYSTTKLSRQRFEIRLENDGNAGAELYQSFGRKGNNSFRVTYRSRTAGANITAKMTSGIYETNVTSGSSVIHEAFIKPKRNLRNRRRSFTATLWSRIKDAPIRRDKARIRFRKR